MHISSLLQHVFNRKQWHVQWDFHVIFQSWSETVGRNIAAHAQPALIRNNVLWVHVDDSAWMQHLHLLKPGLLNRINTGLGERRLHDIRFVMQRETVAPEKKSKPPATTGTHLPPKAKIVEFNQGISCLQDKEARRSLRKLWLAFQRNA